MSEQALLAGLSADELTHLASLGTVRTYQHGQRIITAAEPATSLFFLRSGVVHVKLPDGIRLATITAGMAFGEMGLFETHRSADVLADNAVTALEIPLRDFQHFREEHPRIGERIMRNLAQLLANRLIAGQCQGEFADDELTTDRPSLAIRPPVPPAACRSRKFPGISTS